MAGRVCYLSPWVPPEWIAAHGLAPARVAVPGTSRAAPEGACPYAWAVAALAESLPPEDALVLASTCDQLRRTAGLIPQTRAVLTLHIPATCHDGARAYYADELRRLGRFLCTLGGQTPTSAQLRSALPVVPTPVVPTSSSALRLETKNRKLETSLLVLGGHLRASDRWLFDVLANSGAHVVDGTDGGLRTQPAPFDLARDPFEALVDAYFAIPDVFRRPDDALLAWIERTVARARVAGVVLVRQVWCDLWHALAARLRERLRVPLVEIELAEAAAPQRARTRIESLLEARGGTAEVPR